MYIKNVHNLLLKPLDVDHPLLYQRVRANGHSNSYITLEIQHSQLTLMI